MAFRYNMLTLMLLTAFVGICLAGGIVWMRVAREEWILGLYIFALCEPIWGPLMFVAYLIGRRSVSPLSMLTFGIIQVSVFAWLVSGLAGRP